MHSKPWPRQSGGSSTPSRTWCRSGLDPKRTPGALGTAAGQGGIGDEGVLSALNRHHPNHKTIRMKTPPAGRAEPTKRDR
jgi:hypothetical protein